jgi:hypothetical protein
MVEADDSLRNPVVFAFLDRRVLLSLEQVIEKVRYVTGGSLTITDLTRMGDSGWIPILSNSTNLGVKIGIPLYGPSRIGLLLELQRKGYSEKELEVIAQWEEVTIDIILTGNDNLPYSYNDLNDLELIIRYLKMRVGQTEKGGSDVLMSKLENKSVS